MSNNAFGNIFTITSFGESHGPAVGGVIDGVPANMPLDIDKIQHELNRRRPGQSSIVTPRDEKDRVRILSGVFEGLTTGQPIGFIVENADQHSSDYDNIRNLFRPSHADYTYTLKYGLRDHRGGGRSSARETISRVVAGAVARQMLQAKGITVTAYTSAVGGISIDKPYTDLDLTAVDTNDVRCPDSATAARMHDLIARVKSEGDTVGGIITCVIKGCPVGLGDPAFGKLQSRLAAAILSINAAKGFDYGMGFDGCTSRGSEMIDTFISDNGRIATATNHSGGIQGGISNGEDIYFRVAFKPVATLLKEVPTVDAAANPTTLKARGRHDPCVLPRAVPIVEAMAAIVILDSLLLNQATHLR
ncbi:MAG: chorismate synthase [Muribaculaceae bacterium]|nr:chorismate synthase [Muribaculaceae bacterium]